MLIESIVFLKYSIVRGGFSLIGLGMQFFHDLTAGIIKRSQLPGDVQRIGRQRSGVSSRGEIVNFSVFVEVGRRIWYPDCRISMPRNTMQRLI